MGNSVLSYSGSGLRAIVGSTGRVCIIEVL